MNVISHATLPPKWIRKPKARPHEVLDAALGLFAQNGFAATRMDDIAKAAGLSKAAIYLYFPSKDDVFKALVETRVVALRGEITSVASKMRDDPVAGLRHVVSAWAKSNTDERIIAIPRIVLSESARFPELAEYYHRVVIKQMQVVLFDLFEAGITQGIFRPFDTKAAARALVAPLLFEVLRRQAFKGEGDEIPLLEISSSFFDLFLNGITAANPAATEGPPV